MRPVTGISGAFAVSSRERTSCLAGGKMRVGVLGPGHRGTVTTACLAANGNGPWAVNMEQGQVVTVRSGPSTVVEPGLSELLSEVTATRFPWWLLMQDGPRGEHVVGSPCAA
jgi:hypothetical protein